MRPPAMLIADDPALDFLNSIAAPRAEEIEWLADGADLCAWMQQAGLVAAEAMAALQAAHDPKAFDPVATRARALRDSFRACLHDGDAAIYDQINGILAHEHSQLRLQPMPEGPARLERQWRLSQPQDLLVPLAIAMAQLLADPDTNRIRQCEGPTCTLWFKDVSRNNARRWCSMAVCGNRAKAAAHRARNKSR